jgi:hypothetical protein
MRVFVSGIQPGWAATAFQNAAMFSLLFLVSAVICEYLARILDEVKIRPLYFIAEERQSNRMLTDSEVSNVVYDEDNVPHHTIAASSKGAESAPAPSADSVLRRRFEQPWRTV